MAQSVRIAITPDLNNALQVLRQSTFGTLNTTELIKMAIGGFAKVKALDNDTKVSNESELNDIATQSFYTWAKDDGSLEVDNISQSAKVKPFIPEPYVPNR